MRETKKKENIFAKRGLFLLLSVTGAVILIVLVLNMIVPEEEVNTFDEEAWRQAVEQSLQRQEESALVEVQPAQPVHAEAIPVTGTGEVEAGETPSEEGTSPEAKGEEAMPSIMLMEAPVPGGISKDYSGEELVFSDTMQDWRVHEGIDFATNEGDVVQAGADGTVEKVLTDGMMGAMVVIRHLDDVKSIYANLQENDLPQEGAQVKAGDVIGKVGKTSALEMAEEPHLHFEVWVSDQPVNPHPYLGDAILKQE